MREIVYKKNLPEKDRKDLEILLKEIKNIKFKLDSGFLESEHVSFFVLYKEKKLDSLIIAALHGEDPELVYLSKKFVKNDFEDILAETKKNLPKAQKIIFISDENDKELISFLKNSGYVVSFSEYRMILDFSKFEDKVLENLVIREAEPSDIKELIKIDKEAFGKYQDFDSAFNEYSIDNMKIAMLDNAIIGKIKTEISENQMGIYAFSIAKEYRRRGFGRIFLKKIISDSISDGIEKISLEVVTDNNAAINLYKSEGFYIFSVFLYLM